MKLLSRGVGRENYLRLAIAQMGKGFNISCSHKLEENSVGRYVSTRIDKERRQKERGGRREKGNNHDIAQRQIC